MSDFTLDQDLVTQALSSARMDYLGRTGVDLSTIGTWDPHLSRQTRILVPVDLQAFVAVEGATEPTVDLRGVGDDPAPFDAGAAREPGVHLHWAMPDALLGARHVDGQAQPQMADLPDAWVVVRTLQPVGERQVIPTGWVIDARTAQVTPLTTYTGPVADPVDPISPLTGARFGLMSIASYAACADRFAFHDPLSDLPGLAAQAPQGFAGSQAVYTVAGWWTDASQDPLNGAKGPAGLDDALAGLDWYVVHDANDDDVVEPDVRTGLQESRMGLRRPVVNVAPRTFGSDGRVVGEQLTGFALGASMPVEAAEQVFVGVDLPTYQTLLHGSVLGVPVGGALPGADDRPASDALALAIGADGDDIAAAFGAGSLGLGEDARGLAEDALEAFVAGVPTLLGSSDGLDDFAVRQHAQGFWTLPGTPLPGARPDRVRVQDTYAMGPTTVGRKGRAGLAAATRAARITTAKDVPAAHALGGAAALSQLSWRTTFDLGREAVSARPLLGQVVTPPNRAVDQGRTVDRPPPRYHRPAPFVMALRGAHPSHRHHGDGLFDKDGRLLCRYPRSAVPSWDGLVDGSVVLPTLGSGAVPPEVLTVVREAVLLNPYAGDWLARAGAPADTTVAAYTTRLGGEMVRLFGAEGRYDGITGLEVAQSKSLSPKLAATPWAGVLARRLPEVAQITDVLAQHSVLRGLPPSPVALTTWRQPWVPLWLEWEVTLTGSTTVRGWHLDGYDLEPDLESETAPDIAPVAPETTLTLQGRSPLGEGVGKQIQAALTAWVAAEGQRAITTSTDPYDAAVVPELAALGQPLDLLSASLDGLREQLLGLAFVGTVQRADDGTVIADADPTVLFGGTLRIERARMVDAFGRVLDLDDPVLDATVTTSELEVTGTPRTIRVRPRLQDKARWLLRLVDAGQPPGTLPGDLHEAYVDQLDPDGATNPVSGFLLPDHIDESLETFTVAGSPIGEIGHDDVTNAVTWEPSPGRPVSADAGPLVGTQPQDRYVAEIAAGIVRADAPGPRPPARDPARRRRAHRAAPRRRHDAVDRRHLRHGGHRHHRRADRSADRGGPRQPVPRRAGRPEPRSP